jgi:hypothetical protein
LAFSAEVSEKERYVVGDESHEHQVAQGEILAPRHRHTKRDTVNQGVHAEGDEDTQTAHPTRRFGCRLVRVAEMRQGKMRQDKVFEHIHEQKAHRDRRCRHHASLLMVPRLFDVLQALRHHQEQRRSEQRAAAEGDH